MRLYLALTKPRITGLIVAATAIGYFFGLPSGAGWRRTLVALACWRFFHALFGTALLASGTAALNQWMERTSDARMRRTAGRPIPAGLIQPRSALVFGILISLAGFLSLATGTTWAAAWSGLLTLALYLFLYTPLKLRTWLSTAIGAIPGAMPPVIGFLAAGGSSPAFAGALFAILFLWQFPHFYAIAWVYREDYARAGIRMLPVVEPDCRSTARQMLLACAALFVASLLPSILGMDGRLYLVGAAGLSGWFLVRTARVDASPGRARGVLLVSVIYLPLLYSLLALDRVW